MIQQQLIALTFFFPSASGGRHVVSMAIFKWEGDFSIKIIVTALTPVSTAWCRCLIHSIGRTGKSQTSNSVRGWVLTHLLYTWPSQKFKVGSILPL